MRTRHLWYVGLLFLILGGVSSCASKRMSKKSETAEAASRPAGASANSSQPGESEEKVHMKVDRMPQFVGGNPQIWIAKHVRYPMNAVVNNIQGVVFVEFIVEKDGSISHVKVLRSSRSPLLDKEGVRVVSSMPKWIPAEIKGKPVRVSYTLPIRFALSK